MKADQFIELLQELRGLFQSLASQGARLILKEITEDGSTAIEVRKTNGVDFEQQFRALVARTVRYMHVRVPSRCAGTTWSGEPMADFFNAVFDEDRDDTEEVRADDGGYPVITLREFAVGTAVRSISNVLDVVLAFIDQWIDDVRLAEVALPGLLTQAQAAARADVSTKTIARWTRNGQLPMYGDKISASTLDELVPSLRQRTPRTKKKRPVGSGANPATTPSSAFKKM